MVNKFDIVYSNFKKIINTLFFSGLTYFILTIIGIRELVFQKAYYIWNIKVELGNSSFKFSTFILFWLTLISGVIILTFLKNIFSEFISDKARFISKNIVLVNLTMNVGIYFCSIIFAFYVSGISLESLTFVVSALSLGIGFGLQNLVANFISGIILAVEKPIRKNDIVELDTNTFGTVENIGVRASVIKTYDGAEVLVPNSNLISNQVINWTLSDSHRRCKVIVGVSYDANLEIVQNALKAAIDECDNVLSDPEPIILCTNFSDSSIDFTSIMWTNDGLMALKSQLSIKIVEQFRKNNISIPFPQRDIHVIEIEKK